MIYEGDFGSICFYWNDKLITSAPLSKYTQLKDYEKLSKSLIISGLKKGHNLDTQKVMYQVLRNGEPMKRSQGTLQQVVSLIRLLESGMDRLTQHSPYTIGNVE